MRRYESLDRNMREMEREASPREHLLRALRHWDGAATSCELLEACGIGAGEIVKRNTFQAALARLVASGHATRTRVDGRAAKARGWRCFVTNGAQYDYRLASKQPAPRVPPMPRCSCCGERGHNVRTCAQAWRIARAA